MCILRVDSMGEDHVTLSTLPSVLVCVKAYWGKTMWLQLLAEKIVPKFVHDVRGVC